MAADVFSAYVPVLAGEKNEEGTRQNGCVYECLPSVTLWISFPLVPLLPSVRLLKKEACRHEPFQKSSDHTRKNFDHCPGLPDICSKEDWVTKGLENIQ